MLLPYPTTKKQKQKQKKTKTKKTLTFKTLHIKLSTKQHEP